MYEIGPEVSEKIVKYLLSKGFFHLSKKTPLLFISQTEEAFFLRP